MFSAGVLHTDPPLVIETLTFTVPTDLHPLFEYMTAQKTRDMDTLAEYVAEASGIEFESFDTAPPVLMPSGEFAERVSDLLRNLVGAAGVELEAGDLAAILANLRLPVFGSQPRGSKLIKDWGESTGAVLASIGALAGAHAPALVLLAGPAGAIITLGTYGALGGIWVANRLRQRAQDRRTARRAASSPTPPVGAAPVEEVPAGGVDEAEAARLAAMHERVVEKQRRLRMKVRKIRLRPS